MKLPTFGIMNIFETTKVVGKLRYVLGQVAHECKEADIVPIFVIQ